jgi:ppGpp synthetase/RelA/SpoT-type nucleotidyltranferase
MTSSEKNNQSNVWLYDQIEQYQALHPRYVAYADFLKDLLNQAARERAPLAIVEARAKQICSFAEKCQRKRSAHNDPVRQFTDLCGARVITHTYAEVEGMCQFIEKFFDIDAANSVKISQRLRPSEFGYRSIHYIVQLNPEKLARSEIKMLIPEDLLPSPGNPMKAEIQVRTLLEHAWAAFSHERIYKGLKRVPMNWERELAGLAAILEEADKAFMRIQAGLQSYMTSYGSYLSREEILTEIEIQKHVQGCEANDPKLAHKITRLAIEAGLWEEAIQTLDPFVKRFTQDPETHSKLNYQPILRDYGMALCKQHEVKSAEFKQGQELLKKACEMNPFDPDAPSSLGGTYKRKGEEKAALKYYRDAYQRDPADPYAVSNYLVFEIRQRQNISAVNLMLPAIQNAMQRCRDQISIGVNTFWGYYNLGLFHLLLNEPYESLINYARAVSLSPHDWMINSSLDTLEMLDPVRDRLEGYEWIKKVVHLGWAIKSDAEEPRKLIEEYFIPGQKSIQPPVVLFVGGTDKSIENQMRDYRQLLIVSFKDFHGTIIGGGTQAGIAGLAGDIQTAYPHTITSIGFIPNLIPAEVELDHRYHEHRKTAGKDFSALETIQYWIDLISSGINPKDVKVLGINGGKIAGAEFRLALAFGARVGVIAGSGRSADELLLDVEWKDSTNLVSLDNNAAQVHAFICPGTLDCDQESLLRTAKAIHEEYRRRRLSTLSSDDPAMKDWEELRSDYQNSNLAQANHIPTKLQRIGCEMVRVDDREIIEYRLKKDEIDLMAEMEHNRWLVIQRMNGWKFGKERDPEKKVNPYLVPWNSLSEDTKDWSRAVVSQIPGLLKQLGYEIRKFK